MIDSITICGVATYNETGIQINDLKKANFIYGANGCGKTTLSNFLNNPSDEKFSNCTVTWKNTLPLKTLVYNKDFRDKNFGNGKIGGVFTLGQATADEIKNISDKQTLLQVIKQDIIQKRETLKSQETKREELDIAFKDDSWKNIYKKYENDFKEAFKGALKSEGFKTRLLEEHTNNKTALLTIDELREKSKTIFGEVPKTIPLINSISYERVLEIEKNLIWKKIIVGKADVDIAKLIQKLNINDWVNQGRSYIQDDATCPFCQHETITGDFKKQLEDYFDETYLSDLKSINTLKTEYNSLMDNLINELNGIESNQKIVLDTKLNIDKFSAYLKTLISQNTTNNEYLINKYKEPSRSIELVSVKEQLEKISELIANANEEIVKHNKIVANFNTEKNNLIISIWKYIANEFKTDIEKYLKASEGYQKGIDALKVQLASKSKEYKDLDAEIKELSKNVTSIQPTVDEINRLLKSYGFLNFEIIKTTEEGFYQIQREDGTIAESTLSEGEITFITFLYYLQRAKGGDSEENVNDERILVIDDPISSLDSNVLFVVSTLIKEITKNIKSDTGNIKQLILLTHNIYFHKEVSFIDGKHKNCPKTNFWILRKNNKISTIQPYINQNPIQSSYELLWREIKEWERSSGITIQNTMRRIIENYFSILGNRRDDFLITKFESKEDQEICRSLLSWINEGSHTLPDDLYVEAPDGTIGKYLNVFKEIFYHTDNSGHYNMMMGISEETTKEINA